VNERRQRRGTRARSAFLFLLMCVASVALWVGVPVLWLWVGGRIQGASGSVGAAIGVALVGFVVTVLLFVPLLGWLGRRHAEARAARGLDDLGRAALEGVVVVSAGLAAVAFAIWFLFLAGAEPVPLGLPK
jgi:bacteriorhodopsin